MPLKPKEAPTHTITHGTIPHLPNQPTSANPKQIYGDSKVPLHLFPAEAIALGAMSMLEGREKYGQENYVAVPVEAMTYISAALRHLHAYAAGEWAPTDSPVPHLGLALGSIAIIVAAHYAGSLIDNRRHPANGFLEAMAEMQEQVAAIRERYKDREPKHYTKLTQPV